MTLGEKIRDARKKKGITQSEVADTLKVSVQAVSQWENDKTIPTSSKLLDLAQVLELSLDSQLTVRDIAFHLPNGMVDHYGVSAPMVRWGNPRHWNDPFPSNSPEGEVDTRQYLQVTWAPVGEIYALKVRSKMDMEPTFRDGDVVIIDSGRSPERGDYVIAQMENQFGPILAQFEPQGVGFMRSPAFKLNFLSDRIPITVSEENPGFVVGTVREHRRFYRQS